MDQGQTVRETDNMDIGDVVERTGIPTTTLHVWEQKGLIEPVGRSGLRRQFDSAIIDRIAIIVVCQQAGFSLREIADLLDPATFEDGKGLLTDKLEELRSQRMALDRAIEGIQHALECSSPSPIECDGFRAHLHDVLPVTDRDGRSR